jgi:polysaccharide export outer membrane protein
MRRLDILLILLLAAASFLPAQEPKESLLVGPGDELHIQVYDTPDLDQTTLVNDAGMVELVMGGTVKVAGLTAVEAAHRIEARLLEQNILLEPKVQINIVEFATQKVTILGEVRVPGQYSIKTPRSILDVLTLAGGVTPLADRKVVLQRHGTGEKLTYLLTNKPNENFDTSIEVEPGDSILVPRADVVYAIGDFRTPGGFLMTTNDGKVSVLQLVARAGGLTHTAAASKAHIFRHSDQGVVQIDIDIRAMQKGKASDMFLSADDIVYIPFSYLRNAAISINGSAIIAAAGTAAIYTFGNR